MTVLDARLTLREQRWVASNPASLRGYFGRWDEPVKVAVEACSFWRAFVDAVQPLVEQIVLVHTQRVKAIASAKLKNDPVDSATESRQSQCYLFREADYLHRAIFKSQIPEKLALRYAGMHDHLFKDVPPPQRESLRKIVEKRLDVEAVEVALRNKNSPHLLSKKMQALTYLAEASEGYYGDFVNEKESRGLAFFRLAFQGLRTAYKRAKGKLLVRRYRLV